MGGLNDSSLVSCPSPVHLVFLVSLAAESCDRPGLSSVETLAPRTALGSGRDVTHNGHLVSTSLSLLWEGHRLGSSSVTKRTLGAKFTSLQLACGYLGAVDAPGQGSWLPLFVSSSEKEWVWLEEGRGSELCHLVQLLSTSWNLASVLGGHFCRVCPKAGPQNSFLKSLTSSHPGP